MVQLLGALELIGPQNLEGLFGKQMQVQQIGILLQTGPLAMCQLLMYTF